MNLEDIDIDVTCFVRLRPRIKLSTAEQIEIEQEGIRINCYLNRYAEQIENLLRSGKKLTVVDFEEANNGRT